MTYALSQMGGYRSSILGAFISDSGKISFKKTGHGSLFIGKGSPKGYIIGLQQRDLSTGGPLEL